MRFWRKAILMGVLVLLVGGCSSLPTQGTNADIPDPNGESDKDPAASSTAGQTGSPGKESKEATTVKIEAIIDGIYALTREEYDAYKKCISAVPLSEKFEKSVAALENCKQKAKKNAYVQDSKGVWRRQGGP